MGSEESKEMSGERILEQGDGCLWDVVLTGREAGDETEEGFDIGEGCCVFRRCPGMGTEAAYCRTGVEHLRLLRHPNILKYVWSEVSTSCITMVTEPVVPLMGLLTDTSVECLVMGWRGVANGLTFLHTKAGLSHNNLSMLSVFVGVVNSQWKVGGLELSCRHSKMNSEFISAVSSLRYKKAIPPEDKTKTPPTATPPHARDVWAFGHLILSTLDKADLNDKVGDSVFLYVQDEMLNSDPCERPTPSQVSSRSWMRSEGCEVFEFLTQLTLKTQSEKESFFAALPARLFGLHPFFLAEHLVPLLVTPLVMGEPGPRPSLWKHLLTPGTEATPRPPSFSEGGVCPLLEEDLFLDHVLPLLLNLFECREVHVRTVLLDHLSCFSPVCSQDDLMTLILPEVLLGLKDGRVGVVQATLHALGDLVPLVGTEAVLGTTSEQLFKDSTPRSTPVSVGVATSRAPHTSSPPVHGSREERQQRMKLKREQQKLKRQLQPKLGKLTSGSLQDEDVPAETTPIALPTTEDRTEQYSPSISHDEETPNDEVEEWEATNSRVDDWDDKLNVVRGDKEEEEEDSEAWEDFDESVRSGGGEWGDGVRSGGGGWGDGVRSGGGDGVRPQRTSTGNNSRTGGMKLKLSKPVATQPTPSQSSPADSPLVTTPSLHKPSDRSRPTKHRTSSGEGSEFRTAMRGRLSEQDLARLEAKKMYASKEPDLFADMEPTFASTGQTSSTSRLSASGSREDTSSGHSLSSAMQYQPREEESQGWGDDDWNDF